MSDSLENENSFSAIYNYYVKMMQFRNIQDIPLILVGTQGENHFNMKRMSCGADGSKSITIFIREIFKFLVSTSAQMCISHD